MGARLRPCGSGSRRPQKELLRGRQAEHAVYWEFVCSTPITQRVELWLFDMRSRRNVRRSARSEPASLKVLASSQWGSAVNGRPARAGEAAC
jgi:hypothetical protein